jgi:demethylmenaquinone methyltransferase / 2-methoxy-6-polyprenyl-1,4-benzoquinol methylase
MDHDSVTPYQSHEEKNRQVAKMFDNIAKRYDLLNSLLSLRIHKGWRKKCVELLAPLRPEFILDVATGTGDFAIACAKLKPKKITGIDISEGMLEIGRRKVEQQKLSQLITLENGDAETVTLVDGSFDAIVVGFGVRNFQNLEKGLSNLLRMLKPGGKLIVLEFSYPTHPVIKGFYRFYTEYITPAVGRLFSKDKRAYTYLSESVKAFPHNQDFVNILAKVGFTNSRYDKLTFGIAAIYEASR